MAKYCKSCGREYKGDFCEHCGYGKKQEKSKQFDKYKSNRQIKEEKIKRNAEGGKKPVSGGRIALLVLMIVAVTALIVYGLIKAEVIKLSEKTDPIADYFEAIAENDYDKYVSSMPEAIAETYDEYIEKSGLSKDTFLKESYYDYYEILGDSFTAEVKCGDEVELGGAEIMDAEDSFKANFNREVEFKEAFKIYTEVKFEGSEKTETYFYDVYVAKIGFSWYVVSIDDYYENTGG